MTDWPSTYRYAMAHDCPTCHAPAGVPCNAPNKQARHRRVLQLLRQTGSDGAAERIETSEQWAHRLLHLTRQRAGVRHYNRDVAAAPRPEDRVPGQRYDTLGTPAEDGSRP